MPVETDDRRGQDMTDGAAPPHLTSSLPPTRFVFKRDLTSLNNTCNNSATNVSNTVILCAVSHLFAPF